MTTEKVKRPLAIVEPVARQLADLLAPACARLEIAGSIRRRKTMVGDVELLAIPRMVRVAVVDASDLFKPVTHTTVNQLWAALDEFAAQRKLLYIRQGERYRAFRWPFHGDSIQVDLFTATAETWGNQFMIRTGSAEFSQLMMARYRVAGYASVDGAVHRLVDGKPADAIPTPTEESVFQIAGMKYVAPQFREAVSPNNWRNPA